jgi:hypothetical protein
MRLGQGSTLFQQSGQGFLDHRQKKQLNSSTIQQFNIIINR